MKRRLSMAMKRVFFMNRLIEDMEMAKKKENFQKSNRKKVKINRVNRGKRRPIK